MPRKSDETPVTTRPNPDPVDAEAVRFTKSWHRLALFHDALWYRGVNLGEADEYLLFTDVLAVLFDQERRGVSPVGAASEDSAKRPCDRPSAEIQDFSTAAIGWARCPELEAALAAAVPENARTVLVLGGAAAHVARAVRSGNPTADVTTASSLNDAECDKTNVVVIAAPLPHTCVAETLLRGARQRVGAEGTVVAVFWNGETDDAEKALVSGDWPAPSREPGGRPTVGGYCRNGVEIVLSRAELELAALTERGGAWVVAARPRCKKLSPFGEARLERRGRGDALNKRGEEKFLAGDVSGALEDFAAATNEWNEEAAYFNNLAAAYHALKKPDDAWHRVMEALHLNPHLESARHNLLAIAETLGRTEQAAQILALFGSGVDGSGSCS